MFSKMVAKSFFRCLNGPRLYRIYKINDKEVSSPRKIQNYDPNTLETYADGLIKMFTFCWYFGVYTSPVILFYLYRKVPGYYSPEGTTILARYIASITAVYFSTLFIRGLGRYSNSEYMTFLNTLHTSKQGNILIDKASLSKYDFDFCAWPVEFRWNDPQVLNNGPRIHASSPRPFHNLTTLGKIANLPLEILSYTMIHSFGRRLIYPGAVSLLQYIVAPVLSQGRTKLIAKKNGERFKLLTRDGNEIDSMFVDRRNPTEASNKGNILVICCEGNAGFYEYGIMVTPLTGGYSVLGWNHPGFAGSTGTPFPDQEKNAIDVVMQLAIYKLGFAPENILLYAWSIGGYTATWAAMNYPNINGLVLDATFDDILPLALSRMMPILKPVVVKTIRSYMDLNNLEHLKRFSGPVYFVRRIRDEMISTRPSAELQTNRGNELIFQFLKYRYPEIVNESTESLIWEWLFASEEQQQRLLNAHLMDPEECENLLKIYLQSHRLEFPLSIGEDFELDQKIRFTLFLIAKHMRDYDSTHCTPLPLSHFDQPWVPLAKL